MTLQAPLYTYKGIELTLDSFLGDANNDSLQRIYGVSFPDKKQMAAHKKFLEEATKRDHRLIGKQQELYYFDETSPGSAMWLPHGMRIHNAIMEYIREEYWNRGYDEVMTPNMFNVSLWEQSGHLAHYKEDMFLLDVDKEQFGLKPMNCPGRSRFTLPVSRAAADQTVQPTR
jgi:threonyl-tRNA synthetase